MSSKYQKNWKVYKVYSWLAISVRLMMPTPPNLNGSAIKTNKIKNIEELNGERSKSFQFIAFLHGL